MIMATVTLAAIKIAGVLLGLDRYTTVFAAGAVTVVYSALSGLWGVVATDLLLFFIALVGSVIAAVFALRHPAVGGLDGLLANPDVAERLAFVPDFSDWRNAAAVFVIPLAVQWWSTWYPGSEPGGGGYVAQRMLAARDERDAMRATLWFNIAHYALRPWPWILVALCSLVVYPTLDSLAVAFPAIDPAILRHDLAYPAMLLFLPHGLLGLVVASLAAAYMSTISTHLNWGASYLVGDLYRRFLVPDRDERHYVRAARVSTLLLIVLMSAVSLWLENALQAFQILLQIGAGTGLIFLLRWFWWRINAWSEIAAMVVSFSIAVYFQFLHGAFGFEPVHPSVALLIGVAITTVGWLLATLLTAPTDRETLRRFYEQIRPAGRGWRRVLGDDIPAQNESLVPAFACWFLGCTAVYSVLFAVGSALYKQPGPAAVLAVIAAASVYGLFRFLPRVQFT
jgi:Na+/proline symporter